jgi:Zn-dependent M28 family amino/carboxypeptidase
VVALVGVYLLWQKTHPATLQPATFSGERAYQDVLAQMEFGPRTPGSPAHAAAVDWMLVELQAAGWQATVQEAEWEGQLVRNVVAERGSGAPWILLGAHYDSRIFADRDPEPARQQQPVPGANDGASGVALLLEIARVLPADYPGRVTIVFFDAEDNGGIPGWDWIMGSRAYAASLEELPDAMVLVDLVGDADLALPYDGNSDEALREEIWALAAEMGYGDIFVPEVKYTILDDHVPFLERGIPAVDIIDLDYEYWHTTADTADKVSVESLQVVGEVLLAWLLGQR